MRSTHAAIVAAAVIVLGIALAAVIGQQGFNDPATTIPPTLKPATPVPVLPVQRGVVPLQPTPPTMAPNQPKTNAATTIARNHAHPVSGNEDWISGQPQRQMASRLCGDFGISC